MKRLLSLLALALPLAAVAEYPNPTGSDAARTFPFSMIGQLTFFSGNGSFIGSGTVVQPRGVLTAAHTLYDPGVGWSTDLIFKRGHYDGSDLSIRSPRRLYVLAGYQDNAGIYGPDSVRTFARDTGGMFFMKKVAGGGYLGWSTDLTLLTGKTFKLALGYGASTHSGEELLSVNAVTPFASTYGSFYESEGLGIEGGMSGGPVICTLPDGSPSIGGVVVSSSAGFPVSGGIRIVNGGVSSFILNYLGEPTAP